MQLFQTGTGKFCPLSDEQIGELTEAQAGAYAAVANATQALSDAEAELATAQAKVEADLKVLSEVEKNAPKFDADAERVRLVKEMIATQAME